MENLPAIDPESATGKARDLLDRVDEKLGMVPNIMRTMAHSPAVLEGYLNFSDALSNGDLSPKLVERIALLVSERNGCDYCLALHTAFGKTVGLSDDDMLDSRRGVSPKSRVEKVLQFAGKIVESRGRVIAKDIDRLRRAGFSDGEIVEIVANVVLTLFTCYFNHVAGTEPDFPEVQPL